MMPPTQPAPAEHPKARALFVYARSWAERVEDDQLLLRLFFGHGVVALSASELRTMPFDAFFRSLDGRASNASTLPS